MNSAGQRHDRFWCRREADSLHPSVVVKGFVLFTASLAEEITAHLPYFFEPHDFSDLIATYQAYWNKASTASLDSTGTSDSIHLPQQ